MNRHPIATLVLLAGLLVMPAAAAPVAGVPPVTTGATIRVSLASGGAQANEESEQPVISADGTHVAFVSRASNLVAGELAGVGDLNRDGHVDLVARTTATGELWLYPGTGAGLGSRKRNGTGWNSMRDLTGIGDADRDGFNDLIAVQSATGRLFRFPWLGTAFGTSVLVGRGWTTDFRPVL